MGHKKDIQYFNNIVKGRNFFTPLLDCYYKTDKGIIEVSISDRLYRHISGGKDVYGVTVVEYGKYNKDKSNVFNSSEEVVNYIFNNFNVLSLTRVD